MDFNKPIPGQSLTVEPRKYPYERLPEITDPEEAIQMHLTRLSDPEMTQNIIDLIEVDPEEMDIVTITKGILRSAVATGIHSIDVSLTIAPVIHEFIKQTAEQAGLEYEEGLEDKKAYAEGRKKISKAKAEGLVSRALRNSKTKEAGPEMEGAMSEEEMTMEQEPSQGFFSRPRKEEMTQ